MFISDNLKTRRKAIFAIGICGILAIAIYVAFSLRAGETYEPMVEPTGEPTVQFISSSEAREKINEHQDAFILDVRSNEEFYSIRIPGAVNIPHLMIASMQDLLPDDRHSLIFVHCRVGMRATTAANTLLELGYTNIIVFPGMDSWEYETVSG